MGGHTGLRVVGAFWRYLQRVRTLIVRDTEFFSPRILGCLNYKDLPARGAKSPPKSAQERDCDKLLSLIQELNEALEEQGAMKTADESLPEKTQ